MSIVNSQMVLSFECFRAHATHILPLVAVGEFVLSQRRCVAKNFIANLKWVCEACGYTGGRGGFKHIHREAQRVVEIPEYRKNRSRSSIAIVARVRFYCYAEIT